MTRNKTHAFLLAAALALCCGVLASSAPEARAQSSQAPAPPSQKIIKRHFVVEHMMLQSLQVRSVVDIRDLHTFSYSPRIRDKMENI
jgi:hypothetical protein